MTIESWLWFAMLALILAVMPLRTWAMQEHVSLTTNTIVTSAIVAIATAITIALILIAP